ncbi:MAG TPA: RNA polymerase sigma factor [Gammaproteobacteria bacterium]
MNFFKYACKNHFAARQIKACRERLYRLAFSWCHDAMLADDLVQDTLSKALQRYEQLRNDDALDAWLFAILNNQWREYLRRNRPCEDIDDMMFVYDRTPEYWHIRQQTVDHVQGAIAELPLGQRQVITLVDIESMPYMQVSEILDIPVGTVMSRLSRARRTLQDKIIKRDRLVSIERLRSVK